MHRDSAPLKNVEKKYVRVCMRVQMLPRMDIDSDDPRIEYPFQRLPHRGNAHAWEVIDDHAGDDRGRERFYEELWMKTEGDDQVREREIKRVQSVIRLHVVFITDALEWVKEFSAEKNEKKRQDLEKSLRNTPPAFAEDRLRLFDMQLAAAHALWRRFEAFKAVSEKKRYFDEFRTAIFNQRKEFSDEQNVVAARKEYDVLDRDADHFREEMDKKMHHGYPGYYFQEEYVRGEANVNAFRAFYRAEQEKAAAKKKAVAGERDKAARESADPRDPKRKRGSYFSS